MQAEKVASDLAILVAQEHRRANDERSRREIAETRLRRERETRERLEAQLTDLCDLMRPSQPHPLFVPAPRGTPRPRGVLERVQ